MIQQGISEDSWLGIVWFERTASTKHSMIQLSSQAAKDSLISALPSLAAGSTCIGCGIDRAIQVHVNLWFIPMFVLID